MNRPFLQRTSILLASLALAACGGLPTGCELTASAAMKKSLLHQAFTGEL